VRIRLLAYTYWPTVRDGFKNRFKVGFFQISAPASATWFAVEGKFSFRHRLFGMTMDKILLEGFGGR